MSDLRALDERSRRLIRTELTTNFLVEAGAGSGKTHMLAARMAAGVAEGVYRVDQMAAVTFTRKAASELRGRFHLALEAELAGAIGGDAARAERVLSALSNLERFFAGTIHSFCARLLRERPVESGVSPGFTELDEVQDLELQRRVWRDFVSSARADGDPDMMALMAADIRPKDLDSAFATVCVNDDVEFPPGEGECPDPGPAREALGRFWKELQRHLPDRIDPATTCKIQKAALHFGRRLRVSRSRLDRPSVIAELLTIWDMESKLIQKWWADSGAEKKRLRDLIQGRHESFRADVVGPYVAQWRQYVYRLSVGLLTRARDAASAERRRLNQLNYGDLLNLTARVLRENEAVRKALQQKYQYLLVDEFQDTDPVQAEIVFWLAEDGSSSPGTSRGSEPPDWRKVPLRPGALFVVGDPKQSIYRFRRADIDIYNIVRGRFGDPAIGRVLPLTRNFRSVPALCDWANGVFSTRFPTEPTAHSPRFAALDADETKPQTGGVFTLTSPGTGADLLAEDARKIAAYIRSEVDAGRRQFRDFLILTRKKKDRIAPYADALEALDIPLEVSGAGAFGDSAEVRALTLLLRALAEPQDAVLLVAVLRGPLFGLSDPELFAFKQAGGWFSVFHEGTDQSDDDVIVSEPLALLNVPPIPTGWQSDDISELDFALTAKEARLLQDRLMALPCVGEGPCLIAKAAELCGESGPVENTRDDSGLRPWDDPLLKRAAVITGQQQRLERARKASCLAHYVRAVYAALVEWVVERTPSPAPASPQRTYRVGLAKLAANTKALEAATALELQSLYADVPRMSELLKKCLAHVQLGLIRASKGDPVEEVFMNDSTHRVFEQVERRRKGSRARLPLTAQGAGRRVGFSHDTVGVYDLDYRWKVVRTLLSDLHRGLQQP